METRGVAGGPFGSALGRKHYTGSGVPVIRGSQLSSGSRFSHNDLVFVAPEKADQHLRNLASPGDVVITQRGTLGQVGLVPMDSPYERYLLSQSQMKVSVDPGRADPEFLYYALRSPDATGRLQSHALVAGVPHINLGILRAFTLPVASVGTQRRIASFLRSFDELIEINERRIELLEDLAHSLYRERFVRLRYSKDGVADADGPLAVGWRRRPASTVFCVNPRLKSTQATYEKLTMADLDERFSRVFPSAESTRQTGSRFQNDDVLFARITPCLENGKTGLVKCLAGREVGVGSTEFIVLRGNIVGPAFTYCAARSDQVREHAIKSMSGASGRQRVASNVFDSLELIEPSQEAAGEFERHAGPMLEEVYSRAIQNRALAHTRDLLLPRLVTGRLDIADVDLGDLLPDEAGA